MVCGSCLGVCALLWESCLFVSVFLLLVLVGFALVVSAAQANVDIVGCVVLLGSLWVLLEGLCSGSWHILDFEWILCCRSQEMFLDVLPSYGGVVWAGVSLWTNVLCVYLCEGVGGFVWLQLRVLGGIAL